MSPLIEGLLLKIEINFNAKLRQPQILESVWLEEWNNERIENGERIEK